MVKNKIREGLFNNFNIDHVLKWHYFAHTKLKYSIKINFACFF